MPSTEIYLCKPGQALKEGRLVYGDIANKSEAETDAVYRVAADPSLAKVAYYHVKDDGSFRMLLTYTNPKAGKAPSKPDAEPARRHRPRPKAKPKPKSWWQKLTGWFS